MVKVTVFGRSTRASSRGGSHSTTGSRPQKRSTQQVPSNDEDWTVPFSQHKYYNGKRLDLFHNTNSMKSMISDLSGGPGVGYVNRGASLSDEVGVQMVEAVAPVRRHHDLVEARYVC